SGKVGHLGASELAQRGRSLAPLWTRCACEPSRALALVLRRVGVRDAPESRAGSREDGSLKTMPTARFEVRSRSRSRRAGLRNRNRAGYRDWSRWWMSRDRQGNPMPRGLGSLLLLLIVLSCTSGMSYYD